MLDEIEGRFLYTLESDWAEVTWGALASEVVAYFRRTSLDTFDLEYRSSDGVVYAGESPIGANSIDALYAAVDAFNRGRAGSKPEPATLLFPHMGSGETRSSTVHELGAAARTLLRRIEAERDAISTVYGYINPILRPHFPEPHFGASMSGLRLPGEPDLFELTATLGRLELSRSHPTPGQPRITVDLRGRESLMTEFGEIEFCTCSVDPGLFSREIDGLLRLLDRGPSGPVVIEWREGSPSED